MVIAVASEDQSNRKGFDYGIKFYDITNGKIMKRLDGHKSWIECLINLNMKQKSKHYLGSASDDAHIKIWDMNKFTCAITLAGHTSFVVCIVQFSQISEEYLISGSKDKTIKIWNFVKGSCLQTLRGHDGAINSITNLSMRLNSKKQAFASCSEDSQIRIWEYDENKADAECIDILTDHKNSITVLITVVTIKLDVIISGGKDALIKIWDYYKKDLKCQFTLKGHSDEILSIERLMSFNYNSFLASGGKDKELRIWNINNEECIDVINIGYIIYSIMNFKECFSGYIALGVEHSVDFVNILEKISNKVGDKVKLIDLTPYSSNESVEINLNMKDEDDLIKHKYKNKPSKLSLQHIFQDKSKSYTSRLENEPIILTTLTKTKNEKHEDSRLNNKISSSAKNIHNRVIYK